MLQQRRAGQSSAQDGVGALRACCVSRSGSLLQMHEAHAEPPAAPPASQSLLAELRIAIAEGSLERVRDLIAKGARIDFKEALTPIILATTLEQVHIGRGGR